MEWVEVKKGFYGKRWGDGCGGNMNIRWKEVRGDGWLELRVSGGMNRESI